MPVKHGSNFSCLCVGFLWLVLGPPTFRNVFLVETALSSTCKDSVSLLPQGRQLRILKNYSFLLGGRPEVLYVLWSPKKKVVTRFAGLLSTVTGSFDVPVWCFCPEEAGEDSGEQPERCRPGGGWGHRSMSDPTSLMWTLALRRACRLQMRFQGTGSACIGGALLFEMSFWQDSTVW